MARNGARSWVAGVMLALALLAATGCAAKTAYRQGHSEAKKGNWDLAVARFTRALQEDSDNVGYKIALEGNSGDQLKFIYLDARDTLGHYVEYLWCTPERWAQVSSKPS